MLVHRVNRGGVAEGPEKERAGGQGRCHLALATLHFPPLLLQREEPLPSLTAGTGFPVHIRGISYRLWMLRWGLPVRGETVLILKLYTH